jgi:predicted double-glycine peptidase
MSELLEKKTLKVPFRQRTISGCGSHCLANLLNDERFLVGIGDLKFGEGVIDLNKKLQQLAPDLYIDVVFASPSEMKAQPNKLIDKLVFQILWDKLTENHIQNYARPFLVTVKGVLFHSILVFHNFKNDLYYVVDSLRDDIQLMVLDELITTKHITAVEFVCSWKMEDEDRSVFFHKDYLKHIIPEGE